MTAVHRVFILCCLTMSVMVAAFAQPPDTLWTRMFGGNGFDDFLHVCEAPNDGYVLAGVTEFGGNRGWDWWSVKVSNDGNFVWQQTYDSDSFEVCTNVIPTDDGGYLLMGWNGTFWDRAVVVKTNAIGDSLWSCIYDYSGYNNLRGGLQTADRGYILAGTTGWENDFWLMKINSVGDSLWSRTYTYFGSYNNWLGSVIETFDGGFLLGGETWPSDTREYDFWVVKTDNEGNLQWDKTYGGADWEQLSEMVETSDSCYVLAGCTQSYGSGERDYWILKINAQGDSLWSHAFGGSQQDWCYSICQSPNGGFLLAGYNASYDTLNAYGWIVRTDANGDSLWSHLFSGVYGSQFWSVRQTRDEGYILAGSLWGGDISPGNAWVVKLDRDITARPPQKNFTPSQFVLHQNYPNPFNPTTCIQYDLPKACMVNLHVFDVLGREAAVFAYGVQPAGRHSITFDGSRFPSGIYFYRLQTGEFTATQKMVLLK